MLGSGLKPLGGGEGFTSRVEWLWQSGSVTVTSDRDWHKLFVCCCEVVRNFVAKVRAPQSAQAVT